MFEITDLFYKDITYAQKDKIQIQHVSVTWTTKINYIWSIKLRNKFSSCSDWKESKSSFIAGIAGQ